MLGGLCTIEVFTLVDALTRRRIASWRALAFVTVAGSGCALLTGLPQELFPNHSPTLFQVLKNSLGLLSSSLALRYLGLWMGVAAEDRLLRFTIDSGSIGMAVAAGVMALLTLGSAESEWNQLLAITAVINGFSLLLSAIVSVRAVLLGDRTAWGMVGIAALMSIVVTGLYWRGLQWGNPGIGVWVVTAMATVLFFSAAVYLALRRDRLHLRLEKLASKAHSDDPVTGLPRGSLLVSKVDDAIWRSARKGQDCTVICLHLHNLYELAEWAGHHADQQILSAMTARLRRTLGFQYVVGLYHPRCFVMVITSAKETRLVEKIVQRLRYLMHKPLTVTGLDNASHTFSPRLGLGIVSVTTDNADAATLIGQAERQSLAIEQETTGTTIWGNVAV